MIRRPPRSTQSRSSAASDVYKRQLYRLPMGKNHNFGQILTFLGAPVSTHFTDEGQIWCAIADPQSTLTCQISSRSVYSVIPWRRKTPNFCHIFAIFCHILPYFGLRHLVVSPIGNSLTKLNTGAQLQTFPYPTVAKSFLYSNAFMAKSGAQSLTFKSETDRQTNRQTKKNSTFLATPAAGEIRASPNLAW